MRNRVLAAAAVTAATLASLGVVKAQTVKVEAGIPSYSRASGVSGNISSIGSDTMNNLMTLWGESFAKMYPNVKIQIEGKGSSTGPPALISGTAQFGPMSRAMRASEIDQFEKKYGYKPTQLRAAYDALAVYVNKDNPLEKATVAEIDGVFSKTRRRGGKNVANWGGLGLSGDWSARPLSLYGRNSASGTYGFFKEKVLSNGDVALSEKGGAYSDGSYADVISGKYPLARFLYIYVNKAPGKPLDPSVFEFLKLVYSQQGQEIVVKDGYYPLPASVVAEELKKIQ